MTLADLVCAVPKLHGTLVLDALHLVYLRCGEGCNTTWSVVTRERDQISCNQA